MKEAAETNFGVKFVVLRGRCPGMDSRLRKILPAERAGRLRLICSIDSNRVVERGAAKAVAPYLDDRTVQLVLREVDTKHLAVALKGTANEVRQKVMGNLSERAAGNLAEEIDLLGPVRLKDVEEARDNVVKVIRSLEESDQIVLTRGSDEFVE